jgi:hypothetical protein
LKSEIPLPPTYTPPNALNFSKALFRLPSANAQISSDPIQYPACVAPCEREIARGQLMETQDAHVEHTF